MKDFKRLKVGSRIGDNLTILGVIAEERGRHPVYIAWKHDSWCPVACKVFRELPDAEREGAVLKALDHPNIVRSLGIHEPRLLLMEFLDGPVLGAGLGREGPGPVADALRTAAHLGAALRFIHGKGYLHLDLKPSNAILADGRPILFDFGTARPIGYTPRRLVGTDPYMSPEACRMGEALTPAADVFALGATLYELLTGVRPFESRRGNPRPQIAEAARSARELRPALSRSLDDLLLACLAYAPADRPSLDQILPTLNAEIRQGPRMWPAGFDPAGRAAPRRRRSCMKTPGPAADHRPAASLMGDQPCHVPMH